MRYPAALLLLIGLLLVPALAWAPSTTSDCTIVGTGTTDSGDAFCGSVSGSADFVFSGSWNHQSGPNVSIVSDGPPDFVVCRINGAVAGDVEGPALFNGVGGYTYRLTVEDVTAESETTSVETLGAMRSYRPSRWQDGVLGTPGARVVLPDEIPVSVGNAGNGKAELTLVRTAAGAEVRCLYRGDSGLANPVDPEDIARGLSYRFALCSNDSGLNPGAEVWADEVALRVQKGSDRFPSVEASETMVSVDLTVIRPGPAHPDLYRIVVRDGSGSAVYVDDGEVATGDVAVCTLGSGGGGPGCE
jgi:hypothetical protein